MKDELEKTEQKASITAEAASEFSTAVDSKLAELTNLKKSLTHKGDIATVKKREIAEETPANATAAPPPIIPNALTVKIILLYSSYYNENL